MTATARERIESLARGWRIRWYIALAALCLSLTVAGVVFAVPTVLIALTIIVALGVAHWRRPIVDAEVVARHLDRTYSTLEESASLLLAEHGALSAVERIQRRRAERAFAELPGRIILPRRPLRIVWAIAVAFFLLAGNAYFTVIDPLLPPVGERPGRAHLSAPALERLTITVTPPAYLSQRSSREEGDLEVPEGSRLSFEARIADADSSWLLSTDGDSTLLTEQVAIARVAERSMLYQVVMVRDTFRVRSDWHRITVLPDRAPMLTVVRPEERTVLPATQPWRVPVEILASDDHGIAQVRLLATITTGSGEGVRFREDTIPFTSRRLRGLGLTLGAELDLAALGMGPGDELYVVAQAFDGKRPQPNEGRSATLFISITDTTEVIEGELDGLAIDRMPDYFRSQRQIIIDTEKLLADRSRISEAEFKRRSNDIGIDQQLLRLRYNEVAGGEDEGAPTDPMGGREHMAAEPGDPNQAAVADPNARVQADLTAGQTHSHDIVENATLLAKSTKELLQLALGQMWQAELQLRTYKPDTALPYEMKSLEYLEAVRQAARSYVKRVGLEPPPLEPDRKRLTGDLKGISAPGQVADRERTDSFPAIRRVLAGARSAASIDAAAREMAALVIAEPGRHLETLRLLKEWSDAIHAGRHCDQCEARVPTALLTALPPSSPPAAAATPTAPLADRYLERMGRP